MKCWYGIGLDGTLAHYTPGQDASTIGAPIHAMVKQVWQWLSTGHAFKIVTPCVASHRLDREQQITLIRQWCCDHIGWDPEITSEIDPLMLQLWSCQAVHVIRNTGKRV